MEMTPQPRRSGCFGEFFSGLRENPDDEWQAPIATQSDGLVVVRNIRFHSMCEHHLLPFFGSVHVAYYPKNGTIDRLRPLLSAPSTSWPGGRSSRNG